MSKECISKCEMNNDDAVFKFVYGEAMRDATLMGAFEGSKKELANKIEPKGIVKKYINDVLAGNSPCFYKVEKDVEQAFINAGVNGFSFGNVQKLLNMTVKYFFIICYNNPEMINKFSECHCPMDRKMVAIVRRNYKMMNNIAWNQRIPDIDCDDTKDWSNVSWSKIQREGSLSINYYNKFQKMVNELAQKEGISPIEYDYRYWE